MLLSIRDGVKVTKSNVYIARKENKLKQEDVAKIIGRSEQYYRQRENGEREFTIKEGKILADFYGCTLNDLFHDEGCHNNQKNDNDADLIKEITNHLDEIVKLLKNKVWFN